MTVWLGTGYHPEVREWVSWDGRLSRQHNHTKKLSSCERWVQAEDDLAAGIDIETDSDGSLAPLPDRHGARSVRGPDGPGRGGLQRKSADQVLDELRISFHSVQHPVNHPSACPSNTRHVQSPGGPPGDSPGGVPRGTPLVDSPRGVTARRKQ